MATDSLTRESKRERRRERNKARDRQSKRQSKRQRESKHIVFWFVSGLGSSRKTSALHPEAGVQGSFCQLVLSTVLSTICQLARCVCAFLPTIAPLRSAQPCRSQTSSRSLPQGQVLGHTCFANCVCQHKRQPFIYVVCRFCCYNHPPFSGLPLRLHPGTTGPWLLPLPLSSGLATHTWAW